LSYGTAFHRITPFSENFKKYFSENAGHVSDLVCALLLRRNEENMTISSGAAVAATLWEGERVTHCK
jgi:hypothetical protein